LTLAELKDGATIFLDSNVLIYHFGGQSPQCTTLLRRCEHRELECATSALVLAEVCHRLMTLEALERGLLARGNIGRKLGEHPELVRQLSRYQAALDSISSMRVAVLDLTESLLESGLRLQSRYGLLTNDSLIVATMLQAGIRTIASADQRLANVTDVELAVPTDLPILH